MEIDLRATTSSSPDYDEIIRHNRFRGCSEGSPEPIFGYTMEDAVHNLDVKEAILLADGYTRVKNTREHRTFIKEINE